MHRLTARLGGTSIAAALALAPGWLPMPAHAVVPPETTITSGPSEAAGDNYVLPGPVTYTFSSDQVGATFICAVDSEQPAAYQPCTSPLTLDLPFGTHYLRVRAVNGPLVDASAAVRWWYVRNVPCEQAGEAYQVAQGKFFEWQNKLAKAKRKLHHARNHGTAKQFQQAKNKVRKIRVKIKKYKDAMEAATAQEAAVC